MYLHRGQRGRFSGFFLMALALGACDRRAQPGAIPLTPPSAPSAATAMEAPAKPVPARQVPTRLSVALLEPASTTAAGRAAAAAISARVSDCWKALESPDAPPVSLRLSLNQDGTVRTITVIDKKAFASDAAYRGAATAATSAFFKCGPFALSPADYASWKSLALQVTPNH